MPSIKVQNLFDTSLTESAGILASGDINFTVAVAPTYTNGWIVVESENAAKRDLMYYHDVVGSRIYVRSINRPSPKSHAAGVSVKMLDVAEIFNYFSDMVSQAFYTEKTGGLTVKVWGGYVYYNGSAVTVADTSLTIADNTTNYITYTYATNVVSSNTTNVGNVKVIVTTASGLVTGITYKNAKESYIDFSVSITGALPSQSGQTGKSLITDGTNVAWQSPFPTQTGNNGKVLFTDGTTPSWGVIPQASTTVSGSVEIATQAEFDAGTDVGGTGATLVAPPSILKTINGLSELAGEALTIRDSVFLETVTPFAIATSQQAISYSTLNTRVAIPVFGSGVSMTTFKLALKKTASQSSNLNFRIETDNAGLPSGTLFNANGTASITAASLTTSFVDTTITLAGSITVPLGTKVWIIGFAGTYGGETLSSTNFYSVGLNANADVASIYQTFRYNGTTYTSTPVTQTATWTGDTIGAITPSNVTNWTAVSTIKITQLIKSSSITMSPGTCTITQGTNTVTVNFSTHTATFSNPITLVPGAFTITLAYTNFQSYTSTANGVVSDLFFQTSGSALVLDIRSITAVEVLPIPYVSSVGMTLSALAKTNSALGYKLGFSPRVSVASYAQGAIANTSITGPITYPGLTEGSIYYVSTAGLLSTTVGTVKMPIGIAVGGKLNIGRINTGIIQQLSVGASTTSPSFYHHGLSVTIVTTGTTVQTQTSPDNITWTNFFNITNVGTMTLNIPQGYVRVITSAGGGCTIYN